MANYKAIGVAASRHGLTKKQKDWLATWLEVNSAKVLHHGDCIGGDDEVATMFAHKGTYIICHPGEGPASLRAHNDYNDLILEKKPYLVRNRYIVQHSYLILGFPQTEHESTRSGTWQTIRYARKENIKNIVVLPNGIIQKKQTLLAPVFNLERERNP